MGQLQPLRSADPAPGHHPAPVNDDPFAYRVPLVRCLVSRTSHATIHQVQLGEMRAAMANVLEGGVIRFNISEHHI